MDEKELIEACERFLKVWHENGRSYPRASIRAETAETEDSKVGSDIYLTIVICIFVLALAVASTELRR